ncbi:WxL domain-containing protein [Limosilactobacillus vaginalis]|uniref:WxL domain-containing protein n=1 Tax=Limosilactobacillus vaginalis TaxID=1633 RepID=UPI0025A4196C|nr:WxL domain-containing protein [Limosilactobacillus vaginalis]MDM8221002.1 WxL domain-containing protein [Limosilactobacillus vaginalis]
MKRNFWTKLGLLSLACGLFMTAPTAIINADDTTTTTTTSKATLNLSSSGAKLSLDAVPSFPFGTVTTGDILSGQKLPADLKYNNKVTVTDTRLDAKGWQLTVTPTAFTNNGKTIGGILKLKPGDFAFATWQSKAAEGWKWNEVEGETSLNLPGSKIEVASSNGDQEGQASATINAADFIATSHDALASGTYTSTLTWNLNATPDTSASE